MTNKPYMMKASDKENALIAERVVEFLRRRIQIYQSLIPKYIKDEEVYGNVVSPISLNDFLRRHHRIELKKHSEKDEFKMAEIGLKLQEFEMAFAKYIVLEEKEIEKMLGLVKESITKHGLGKEAFSLNEAGLIEKVLEELNAIHLLSGKKKPNTKYLRYAKIINRTKTGFCNKISPSINWNLYYTFKIIVGDNEEDADYKEICCIDESGNEKEENKIASENVLLADDLIVAKLKTRDGKKDCFVIFLNKTVDENPELEQIRISGYFDINSSPYKENILNDLSTELYSINDFLNIYGLPEFVDHIYNYDDLSNLISEFDKLQSFSESQKAGIKMVTSVAASYWTDAFVKNRINKIMNILALNKFARLLSKRIRLDLAKKSYCYLEAEYYENNPLYEIAEEVGLDLAFADNNITMWINRDEVSLGSRVTEKTKTLYKFKETPDQGQPSGTKLTYTPPKTNE